jgi:linearmycin/streptolysin S transport system ATP-binding protein
MTREATGGAAFAGRAGPFADRAERPRSSAVSSTMLTLTGLVKRFGTNTAVDGLSLSVGRGEVFGLLGPNGAGKSTTVHMAVGIVTPDAGQVDVGGLGSPMQPAVRGRIGVAPQALSLYELLTADENLRFFGKMYGLSGASLDARATRALEFVGLADRRRDLVGTYSGGMKRRLNLAAAILHDPDLVLLDEPTVGVDPQSRNAIFESLVALKRAGKTIVYTTHYMEEAARLCDRVAIIDHGKLLALDTVRGLTQAHGGPPTLVLRTEAGEERIETREPLAELNRLAAARGTAMPADFEVVMPTLEQVFLHLTGRSLRD